MTRKFLFDEKFGLVSQMQRAIASVSSNIAEGASIYSNKDQHHFYHKAYASLMDVLCQLMLCLDLGYIKEEEYNKIREAIEKISYQIHQLRKSALNKPSQLSQPSQPSQPKY